MNSQEYMNRIFQTQLAYSNFLISLQYQPQLFQYIVPQWCHRDTTQLNTGCIQESGNFDRTKVKEEHNQSDHLQVQLLKEPQCIKNDTEREIRENTFNGHWSKEEHEQYLEFVNNHYDILKSKYDKKSKKIFKLMSKHIPSRTPTQCRSHHQKFNPLQLSKRNKKSKSIKY